MAERGAYLTGTVLSKPSIFEIAAQNSLAATLDPAVQKLVAFLGTVNPEKYEWLHKWSDEVYLIFITTLQNYYLRNYSASFSETFYGLKRINLVNFHSKVSLPPNKLNLSLIILVIFPYLHKKIQKWQDQTSNNQGKLAKFKNYFNVAYRICKAVKEFLTFYQYLLYLSNQSKSPTLSLRFLSLSLIYSSSYEEISLIELLKQLKHRNFTSADGFELFRLAVIRSIEISAFCLQFLQWWNQEHYYLNLTALPAPSPPVVPEFVKKLKGICPICRKSPRIPTAISVTGFVYCYQCIVKELKVNKTCPVTKLSITENDLIRLYIQ